jgi:hypothetical protein
VGKTKTLKKEKEERTMQKFSPRLKGSDCAQGLSQKFSWNIGSQPISSPFITEEPEAEIIGTCALSRSCAQTQDTMC